MKTVLRIAVIAAFVMSGAACENKGTAPKDAPAPPPAAGQAGEQQGMMEGHPPIEKASVDASAPEAGVIKSAESGSVADVFAKKDSLAGKEVTVRGKVMKFSPMIMGKNWVHLQDGSGDPAAGTNDLTLTTMDSAKVGDVVLAKGSLSVNKDFGAGYTYDVILEDAKLTVE